jgi:hypothetical protein
VLRRLIDREIYRADPNVHVEHVVLQGRWETVVLVADKIPIVAPNDERISVALDRHRALLVFGIGPRTQKLTAVLTASGQKHGASHSQLDTLIYL